MGKIDPHPGVYTIWCDGEQWGWPYTTYQEAMSRYNALLGDYPNRNWQLHERDRIVHNGPAYFALNGRQEAELQAATEAQHAGRSEREVTEAMRQAKEQYEREHASDPDRRPLYAIGDRLRITKPGPVRDWQGEVQRIYPVQTGAGLVVTYYYRLRLDTLAVQDWPEECLTRDPDGAASNAAPKS